MSTTTTQEPTTKPDIVEIKYRRNDAVMFTATLNAEFAGKSLRDADLCDADLEVFRQDLIAEVLKLPDELEALKAAIIEGRINGSTYRGACACLAGTLAQAHGCAEYRCEDVGIFRADSSSPRERWFTMISPEHTPENNFASKMALQWVEEAIAIRDNIRGGASGEG